MDIPVNILCKKFRGQDRMLHIVGMECIGDARFLQKAHGIGFHFLHGKNLQKLLIYSILSFWKFFDKLHLENDASV
jgi:hypothetical protein